MSARRIGILGSGDVGRALASGFADRDWSVTLGTPGPAALQSWVDGVEGDVALGSFRDAAASGDVVDPQFESETPPMLICGNDRDAKDRTDEILVDLGWPGAFDVGDITSARYLEALVPLWVRAGAALDTWRHAFAVVE